MDECDETMDIIVSPEYSDNLANIENGILCNVFYSDDPEEANAFLDMGIDCILTNDYLRVFEAVKARLAKKR